MQSLVTLPTHFITANWQAPSNIRAFTTASVIVHNDDQNTEFVNYNLSLNTGDNQHHVVANREKLQHLIGDDKTIMWLNQTHGNNVVNSKQYKHHIFDADASFSSESNFACAVMTADCLPILITNQQGNKIAAIHAGWKSLYSGVISNAIATFDQEPEQLLVWLAPAITQNNYEVDSVFYERFVAQNSDYAVAFIKNRKTAVIQHYLCDLYLLAKIELRRLGILERNIWQTETTNCTFANPALYSYRRTKITGRMATVICM